MICNMLSNYEDLVDEEIFIVTAFFAQAGKLVPPGSCRHDELSGLGERGTPGIIP